jgi:hypothetical protein
MRDAEKGLAAACRRLNLRNFSLVIKLANETEQDYALELAHKVSLSQQGDPLPDNFPKAHVDMIEDWRFETVVDGSGTKHGL